jgi:hypothetical protein
MEQTQLDQEQLDEKEKPVICKPETVSDGNCNHDFVKGFIDGHKTHYQCSKCWKGVWRAR